MTSVTKQVGEITVDLKDLSIWDFLGNFLVALEAQLRKDVLRCEDLWKEVTWEGQTGRIYERFDAYRETFVKDGTPIPWLKITGLAMIAWIRETNPEMFPK